MAICPLWGQTVYENHAQDYRIKQVDVSPTIGTRPTTNPTLVMESIPNETYTIPHDERSACCKPNVSDTLTHYVHYVSQPIPKVYDVNAAKELDMANTLDTSCRGVWGKQNGTVVYSLEGNGARESHHGPGFTDNDKMYTLNTVEHHAVAYCMGHDERSAQFEKNKTDPLTASDYKQPPVVAQPVSTTGGASVDYQQSEFHDKFYKRQGEHVGSNGLERCSCGCTGKQTIGSLCAHDGRGFNGQDVANDKLIIEYYETNNNS